MLQKIPRLDKVIATIFLLYCLSALSFFFSFIELSVGLQIKSLTVVIGLLIPFTYFFYKQFKIKELSLPYLGIFFLTEFLFILFESNFFRNSQFTNFSFPHYLLIIYLNFLTLINFGKTRLHHEFILKSSLYIVGILILFQYGIFSGLIGSGTNFQLSKILGDYSEGKLIQSIRFGEIIDALIHPNGASVIAIFGILILIVLKEKDYLIKTNITHISLFFLFIPIIFLNATRGASLVLFVILLIYYFFKIYKEEALSTKLYLFTLPLFFCIVVYVLFESTIDKLLLINRLIETNTTNARFSQISVSLNNFMSNPFIGVGYHYATLGGEYTRSNFSYMQILASHGVFYFIIYLIFIIKMWTGNLKNIIILLGSIFSFGLLSFYNWPILESLSVVAYIIHCEKMQKINGTFK